MSERASGASSGKGRPTPKRREAQQRRTPVAAPQTRREAAKQLRSRNRESRGRYREALRTGDERYLPARDQGPVRGFVRDLVDARRNAGNYLLWVAFAVLILSAPRIPVLQAALLWAYPVLVLWLVVDSVLLVRLVRRRVAERFPGESTRGLGSYAVVRSFQLRRLRLPPPKVRLGQRV